MGVGDLHDTSVSFFSPHTHDPVTWRLVTSTYQRRTDHSLELPQLGAAKARILAQLLGLQTPALVFCSLVGHLHPQWDPSFDINLGPRPRVRSKEQTWGWARRMRGGPYPPLLPMRPVPRAGPWLCQSPRPPNRCHLSPARTLALGRRLPLGLGMSGSLSLVSGTSLLPLLQWHLLSPSDVLPSSASWSSHIAASRCHHLMCSASSSSRPQSPRGRTLGLPAIPGIQRRLTRPEEVPGTWLLCSS